MLGHQAGMVIQELMHICCKQCFRTVVCAILESVKLAPCYSTFPFTHQPHAFSPLMGSLPSGVAGAYVWASPLLPSSPIPADLCFPFPLPSCNTFLTPPPLSPPRSSRPCPPPPPAPTPFATASSESCHDTGPTFMLGLIFAGQH